MIVIHSCVFPTRSRRLSVPVCTIEQAPMRCRHGYTGRNASRPVCQARRTGAFSERGLNSGPARAHRAAQAAIEPAWSIRNQFQ